MLRALILLLTIVTLQPLRAATFTYSYDSLNRLTNAAYSDGSAESYSYDLAGNRLLRITIAASSRLDVTPPPVPTNLASTAFIPSQLSIAWNPAFDTGGSGLAGYKVYVNGSYAGTTMAPNFLLSGLFPNSQYCLTVRAYDHYTNISEQSAALCFTTPVFQPPLLASPGFQTGRFQFVIQSGTPGPYNVYVSSNLSDWNLLTNLTLPAPQGIFFDPSTNIFNRRFYQLRWSTNTP